jgi:fructuronate reductase
VSVKEATGWSDRAPVITEPFADWILSGEFPAGRPAWESAGARFVTDIEPFEHRKLWLLNGAHSLLAYSGMLRGHTTVASAIADPECRGWVEALWDEATRNLTADGLDLQAYRTALLSRFENSRIEHHLDQIGRDGVTKLRVRVVVVARSELAAGRDASACARVIAAWIVLLKSGVILPDAHASAIRDALHRSGIEVEYRLVELLDADLAADVQFMAAVHGAIASFGGMTRQIAPPAETTSTIKIPTRE